MTEDDPLRQFTKELTGANHTHDEWEAYKKKHPIIPKVWWTESEDRIPCHPITLSALNEVVWRQVRGIIPDSHLLVFKNWLLGVGRMERYRANDTSRIWLLIEFLRSQGLPR